MSDEYPPHKTTFTCVKAVKLGSLHITTSYDRALRPRLLLTLSHSTSLIPAAAPSPFLSPCLLLPHLFSLVGVSKQLKHLQGVTLGPHAPPNAVSAGGRRQH